MKNNLLLYNKKSEKLSKMKIRKNKILNGILYKMIMINEFKEKDIVGSRYYQ